MGGFMTKCVRYLRVSTTDQNLENQRLVLQELSTRNGHEISHEYSDFGQSGTKRERDGLNQMIEDGKRGKFTTLYVISIDRLSRSVKDLIEVVETLNKYGVQIIFQREQIDTKTPTGSFFLTVLGSLYQLERQVMIERINQGISRVKSQGKHCGRPTKVNSSLVSSVRLLREKGVSIRDISKTCSIGVGTTMKILNQNQIQPI